jgi:hypothetical protein
LPAVTSHPRATRALAIVAGFVLALALLSPFAGIAIDHREAKDRAAAIAKEQNARTEALALEGRTRDYLSCVAGNDFRANDLAKWRFILSLRASANPPSPAVVERFVRYIEQADEPRPCGPDPRRPR